MKKAIKRIVLFLLVFIGISYFLPTRIENPVEGGGRNSYSPISFWHPWGDHRHRGVDIFAKKGTNVHPAIGGLVVATMHNFGKGGNFVLVASSGLRLHYYAHLDKIETHLGAIVTRRSVIGKVGNTGNAAGKAPHLHYSISTIVPQGDWRFDKGMGLVFINPIKELEKGESARAK